MIKNKLLAEQYESGVEEFDIEALRNIAELAKNYVAKEHQFKTSNNGIPNGEFSDFCCTVWSLFTNAVNYGYSMANREAEISNYEKNLSKLKDAKFISWDMEDIL